MHMIPKFKITSDQLHYEATTCIHVFHTGWPRVGCRIGNLIESSLVLKCNPTSTKDVQKALSQGRFL